MQGSISVSRRNRGVRDWRRRGRKERKGGWWGEREHRRERWRVTFSDGIWFSTIFPTRVTALWPTRACWDSLRPSLSFRLFLSPCLFLLWPFFYTNSVSSYFCPSGTSGFMICDGFIFSNIMSLPSSSFRVFSHVTIYLDFFFLVWVIFHLPYVMSTSWFFSRSISIDNHHSHTSVLLRHTFVLGLCTSCRENYVLSQTIKAFCQRKHTTKTFKHVGLHCHFWSMTESLKYFAVFFHPFLGRIL